MSSQVCGFLSDALKGKCTLKGGGGSYAKSVFSWGGAAEDEDEAPEPTNIDQLIHFFVGPHINQPRYFAPLFMNERG